MRSWRHCRFPRRRLSDTRLRYAPMGCAPVRSQQGYAGWQFLINQPDRKTPMKKLLLTLAALCSVAAITTACNTIEGAGKDVERAGEKIEKSAQRNK